MPVMTWDNCRTAIVDLIATVPGAGRTHKQRRIIRSEQDLKRLLFDDVTQKLVGWMVSPAPNNTAVPDVKGSFGGHGQRLGGNVLTAFQFQIEGYHQLDDANDSEQVFTDLAWAVADEFMHYGSIPLNGAKIPGLAQQMPTQIEQFGYIMFAGNFLLHYTRLSVGFVGRTTG